MWLCQRHSIGVTNFHGAASSARYRYNVARLTPKYFAMSLLVCPSP